MQIKTKIIRYPIVLMTIVLVCDLMASFSPIWAQEDLAKQSQNPLSNVSSAPYENNLYFNIGPSNSTAYVLNIKPVHPVSLGGWNLINRFIIPVIYSEGQDADIQPSPEFDLDYVTFGLAQGSEFGLGDVTYQGFFSPTSPGKWIWGLGPALVIPIATEDRYSSNKWSAGPAAAALTMPGNWVVGVLAQNVWSFAGESNAKDINKFLFQYFINYNFKNNWYISSTPVITANWEANSNNIWTIPFGGGVGRLFKSGNIPIDIKLSAYWNVEKPKFAADWSLEFTVKLLFPK